MYDSDQLRDAVDDWNLKRGGTTSIDDSWPPWLVSVGVFAYVLLVCEIIGRHFIVRNLTNTTAVMIGLEVIATAQGCMCTFESGQFRKFYGPYVYVIVAACVSFANRSMKRGAYANPAAITDATVTGTMPVRKYVYLLVAQLVGGSLGFRLSRLYWRLQLQPTHTERHMNDYYCMTDLTVSVAEGLIYEFGATFIDQIVEAWFARNMSATSARASGALLCACMTQGGVHLTGMYYNPILATVRTYGCDGLAFREWFALYWMAPIVAQIAGTLIVRRMKL